MIDSHCHLDVPAFHHDVEAVLQRSRQAGVTRFLIPGTTLQGWERQQQLAAQHSDIDLAFGLHPYFIDETAESTVAQLEKVMSNSSQAVLAVGEIGLDAVCTTPADVQETLFSRQLAIAQTCRLPVILHHRKTHHRLLGLLKSAKFQYGGIIHAFSGSVQDAQAYCDLGFLLGVGGTITYERAAKSRASIASVGLNNLVLETDSPDMPLSGRQGERNSPAYLIEVARALSELTNTSVEEVAVRTSSNYRRLFRLPL